MAFGKSSREEGSHASRSRGGRAFGGGARTALGDVTNRAARAPGAKPRSAGAAMDDGSFSARHAASMAEAAAAAPDAFSLADHGVIDIDKLDSKDPLQFADYVNDIYKYYKESESEKHVGSDYMTHQTDINPKMRSILVDWLVEVHLKFKLMPETLYLTVNIIDRFLERKLVMRNKLQLVGVTAMLLASKYEEIYAPEVRDFTYITDNAYTREQILKMEGCILGALKFKVTVPTAYVFTRRFLKAAKLHESRVAINMAHYLVERTLQEYSMLRHKPSLISAAATNMTLRTVSEDPDAWSHDGTLAHYTGFTQAALEPCIREIEALLDDDTKLRAVAKKYSHSKYYRVSTTPVARLAPKE